MILGVVLATTLDNDAPGFYSRGRSSFHGENFMDEKIFKTYTELKDLLILRGMIVEHPRFFTNCMAKDTYYNIINGYKKYFIASLNPEKYHSGTTFEQVYALYSFDQTIRTLFLTELLRIEKNLKSLIAYHFSESYGHNHHKYLDIENFKNNSSKNRNYAVNTISSIERDLKKYSKHGNTSICHYLKRHKYVPLWVLFGVLSFGRIAHFYSCMKLEDQQKVSAHFDMSAKTLDGFFYFLDSCRNTCAHGNRIYTSNIDKKFQHFIPDTKIHCDLQIPKNKSGNYLHGKTDILAMLISFKIFLCKSDFSQLKKKFKKAHKNIEKVIPEHVLANIDKEMGISNALLALL